MTAWNSYEAIIETHWLIHRAWMGSENAVIKISAGYWSSHWREDFRSFLKQILETQALVREFVWSDPTSRSSPVVHHLVAFFVLPWNSRQQCKSQLQHGTVGRWIFHLLPKHKTRLLSKPAAFFLSEQMWNGFSPIGDEPQEGEGTGLVSLKVTWSPVWGLLRQLDSILQTQSYLMGGGLCARGYGSHSDAETMAPHLWIRKPGSQQPSS